MKRVFPTASILQLLLLPYVATIDVATRVISNEICLALALIGIAGQPTQMTQSR
jgi:prepilin peptidase CpaA